MGLTYHIGPGSPWPLTFTVRALPIGLRLDGEQINEECEGRPVYQATLTSDNKLVGTLSPLFVFKGEEDERFYVFVRRVFSLFLNGYEHDVPGWIDDNRLPMEWQRRGSPWRKHAAKYLGLNMGERVVHAEGWENA